MNLSRYISPLAKRMPMVKPESRPKSAGEIYYLWEALTAGHKLVVFLETYTMNTGDAELRLLLQGIGQVVERERTGPMEDLLRREGFAVPPRPDTGRLRSLPERGTGLSDGDILRSVITEAQMGLNQDARAVGAVVNDDIRAAFVRLLHAEMKQYVMLLDFARARDVYYDQPAATAKADSLNVDEVARLWEELGARHLTVASMATFLAGIDDHELTAFLRSHVRKTSYPQLEKLAGILKAEGFSVPPSPADRLDQGRRQRTLSDVEILCELVLGAQAAIRLHVRGYSVASRKDVREIFAGFVRNEIDEYEKLLGLAKSRQALVSSPQVAARQA